MKVLIAIEEELFVKELTAFLSTYPWPENSEFHVLNVAAPVKIGSFMSVLPGPLLENISKERVQSGESMVAKAKEQIINLLKTEKVHSEVREGLPIEEIIESATEIGAGLIIMGAHRRSAVDLMVGNITQSVVSSAPCAVVVIPLPKKTRATTEKAKPHIIV